MKKIIVLFYYSVSIHLFISYNESWGVNINYSLMSSQLQQSAIVIND